MQPHLPLLGMVLATVIAAPRPVLAAVTVACTPRDEGRPVGRSGEVRLPLRNKADVAAYTASCLSPALWPEITITGKVTRNDADALAEVADYIARTAPQPRSVELVLNSSGGSIAQAMRIGEAFSVLETVKANVPKGAQCSGACTFIFAAGQYRFAQGQIGVHRPTEKDLAGMPGDVHEAMRVYLTKNGVEQRLLKFMRDMPRNAIRHLTHQELKSFGLGFQNALAQERERRFILDTCGQDYLNTYLIQEKIANEQCYGQRGTIVGRCLRMLDTSMQQLFGWARKRECHYR
ncbi:MULTISPECIES: ATP-dependent Clp protease proteolytic subunit [Azospirillum]|uniref:ATP-dependent Clp protease proteolytic subunit n=1 Tax=Azospirillum TaxID=191 RepID=UPI001478093F|nr:ATP-dependent Clp protease proteolytic subunit [Azospirillum brasilense]